MNRSQKASRYGSLAERKARDHYGLEAERDSWHDARGPDGRPFDVKAAMLNRASGQVGRFRLWRDQHGRLEREDGGYVFVLYRAVGRGLQVVKIRSVAAEDVSVSFYGAGEHEKGEQMKVHPRAVFGGEGR